MKKINDTYNLIKGKPSRNRMVLPPMDTTAAIDFMPNEFHIQHYGARAFGGFGTIIIEATGVSPEGAIDPRDMGLWNSQQVEKFKPVVNVIHKGGAIAGVQLGHAGGKTNPGITYDFAFSEQDGKKLMTVDELNKVKNDYINAAKNAKLAGFDFVEIHAAHGYLLSTMLHKDLNKVFFDEDILVRGAMLVEMIDEISKHINVGIRLSGDDGFEKEGMHPSDFKRLIERLDGVVDYFHISGGETISKRNTEIFNHVRSSGENLPFLPHTLEYVEMVKQSSVLAVNRYRARDDIERALSLGIDAVAMGRFSLFNPNILFTDILTKDEITEEKYGWNNNPWWSPSVHAKRYKK